MHSIHAIIALILNTNHFGVSISRLGYTLVTVFSLMDSCGLLILLGRRPPPGTALHDVTTGVILGLSTLTLLMISLGVVTSRWCRGPPPDNRVEVYNHRH